MDSPVPASSFGNLPYRADCPEEALSQLAPGVLDAYTAAAKCYFAETGERPVVTAGKRSLMRMAELMAGFSNKQLQGMYGRHGIPSYLTEIFQARKEKFPAELTAKEIFRILRQRSEGYISAHLYGAAVDTALAGLSAPGRLAALLEEKGFRVLNEESLGIPCLHAGYRSTPVCIIRE